MSAAVVGSVVLHRTIDLRVSGSNPSGDAF